MEYNNVEDYFFWKGLEQAQITPGIDLQEYLYNLVAVENRVSSLCREAAHWGFLFGLQLTAMEYYETQQIPEPEVKEYPKQEKIEVKEPVVEESIINDEYPIKGNC